MPETGPGFNVVMVPATTFAPGGWWAGLSVASVLIAVLAALVVTVITLVNRIERQAASIGDHLAAAGGHLSATSKAPPAWSPSSTHGCVLGKEIS